MRTRILALTLVTSIFTITSQAQFLKLKSYGAGAGLTQILKSDLNNDNKPDIVGVGSVNGKFNVTALLGNGHGGFSAPVVSPITGITLNTGLPPQTVGDFNHDGVPDFAFVGTDPVTGATAVGVMLGNGDGSFKPTQTAVLPNASTSGQLAAGDFTGHGNMDLVYANSTNIMVLPGKGNGHFSSPIVSNISQFTRCIAVGVSTMMGNSI
jgi:hypothetical protein